MEQRPGGQHLHVFSEGLGVAGMQRPVLLQRRRVVAVVGVVVREGGPLAMGFVSESFCSAGSRFSWRILAGQRARWIALRDFGRTSQQAQHVEGAPRSSAAGGSRASEARGAGRARTRSSASRSAPRPSGVDTGSGAMSRVSIFIAPPRTRPITGGDDRLVLVRPARTGSGLGRRFLEQVVQVAVEEAVVPDQLEEHVEEQARRPRRCRTWSEACSSSFRARS